MNPVILVASFMLVFLVVSINLSQWSDAYETFRRQKFVHCPEMHRESTIRIAPGIAALTTVVAAPKLVIRGCALWPEQQHCGRQCLRQFCHRV